MQIEKGVGVYVVGEVGCIQVGKGVGRGGGV